MKSAIQRDVTEVEFNEFLHIAASCESIRHPLAYFLSVVFQNLGWYIPSPDVLACCSYETFRRLFWASKKFHFSGIH